MESNSKVKKSIVIGFFALFFLLGLFVFSDYGMSWDERSQWENNGHANINYVLGNDNDALLVSGDKYHGPAFEIVLVIAEKLASLTDSRDIFLMRHLLSFVLFFISGFFFFKLAKKIVSSEWLALIGVLIYFLSPHVFAHAFYNTKDIAFLSLFTISIYQLITFLENQSYRNALLFAFFTGFTTDVRIMGLIIPFIFLVTILISFAFKSSTVLRWKSILLYAASTCFFIFLFWPVLWDNPLYHFIEAFKEAFFYHWEMDVLYRGHIYNSSALPWHYLPFWIFISKPIMYSLLFLSGSFFILKKFISSPVHFLKEEKKQQILTLMFYLPFLLVVIPKSILFDTGRHLYFLNAGFVLISIVGLEALLQLRNKKIAIAAIGLLFISLFKVITDMVRIHPYQNLYFNECVNGDMQKIKERYELDYWGLSARALLEKIIENDSSKHIAIYTDSYPAMLNIRILPENDRKRIRITDTVEKANYYVAGYRWHDAEKHPSQSEFYSVKIGNAKLITAFKFRDANDLYTTKGRRIFLKNNDFEKPQEGWTANFIGTPEQGAHSGGRALWVNKEIEYSDNLILKGLDSLVGKQHLVLRTDFFYKKDDRNGSAKLVVTVESLDGKTNSWQCLSEINGMSKALWTPLKGAIELPVINSGSDIIKIYLWNNNKTEIFIDDIQFELIEETSIDEH